MHIKLAKKGQKETFSNQGSNPIYPPSSINKNYWKNTSFTIIKEKKRSKYLKVLTAFTSFFNSGLRSSDMCTFGSNNQKARRKEGTCFDSPSL